MSASRKNRGGRPRGVNTPISASGTHDLGIPAQQGRDPEPSEPMHQVAA